MGSAPAAQFWQLEGALLPEQAQGPTASGPSNGETEFGLEELSPAEAQNPLGAAAASIVEQVSISMIRNFHIKLLGNLIYDIAI